MVEGEPRIPEEKKPEAWIKFGLPDHEDEYVLILGFDIDIPSGIEEEIRTNLGEDWEVLSQGGRLEIRNKKEPGARDDEKVREATRKALEHHGYELG